jgi:hypothetical protein
VERDVPGAGAGAWHSTFDKLWGGAGRSAVVSRIWVVALGVVALAASCTSGSSAGPNAGGPAATRPPVSAGSAGRPCTPRACISLSRLAHSIDSQLKGNVVGYVALIGPSIAVSSGLARTAADPPKLAMGPGVMVNVASVGKMFTTIAVLRSLARHHLSTGSRIWPFLPPDWTSTALPHFASRRGVPPLWAIATADARPCTWPRTPILHLPLARAAYSIGAGRRLHGVSIGIRGHYPSWSRRRVR